MENRYLILSSWLVKQQPLLALGETIGAFLVDATDWRAPYGQDRTVQIEEKYYLKSTWNPTGNPIGGQPLDYWSSGNEKARQEILEREIGKIQIGFPVNWRNPYVINKPVYQGYSHGVDIFLEKVTGASDFFSSQVTFYSSSLWFSPVSVAEVIYDSYEFVRYYQKELGYELNKGSQIHHFDGQEYIVKDELTEENRYKVLVGIAKYINHFSVEAAILTYRLPAKFDRQRKIMSYSKEAELVAPLYYLGPAASLAPKSLQLFNTSYFAKEIEGVLLYLEADHFGFLR